MQLRRLKRNMVHVIKRILAFMPMLPKKYYCTVCGSNVTYFLPYGVKTEVFAEKEIIGGGYRKNVRCPICGANDRMRFLDYILCKKTDIYSNPKNRILHFAPEKCIETKIRNVQNRGGAGRFRIYYWRYQSECSRKNCGCDEHMLFGSYL